MPYKFEIVLIVGVVASLIDSAPPIRLVLTMYDGVNSCFIVFMPGTRSSSSFSGDSLIISEVVPSVCGGERVLNYGY